MVEWNMGAYRPNPKGEWSGTERYEYLDWVTYNGSSFLCIHYDPDDNLACIGVLPEGEAQSELYWMCTAQRGATGDAPSAYLPYVKITDGTWDYDVTDKIYIPSDGQNSISIVNVYNGCCGVIYTNKDLELPSNSLKAIDFDYARVIHANEMYFYTFSYGIFGEEELFIWHRTVVTRSD